MNDTTLPKPRRKAALKKGFGLYDWKVLLNNAADLAQRKGAPLRQITKDEVALHNKVYDGWTILQGKVYNVGPYLHYHPGGVDIMKPTLGGDGTELFQKYHRWVNIESLVGKLLIGYLAEDKSMAEDQKESQLDMPPPRPRRNQNIKSLLQPNEDSDDDDEEMELINPWEKRMS